MSDDRLIIGKMNSTFFAPTSASHKFLSRNTNVELILIFVYVPRRLSSYSILNVRYVKEILTCLQQVWFHQTLTFPPVSFMNTPLIAHIHACVGACSVRPRQGGVRSRIRETFSVSLSKSRRFLHLPPVRSTIPLEATLRERSRLSGE